MLFAIGIHVVKLLRTATAGVVVRSVVDTASVSNSSGSPTLEAYLAAEAGSGYIANHIDELIAVTVSVADMNAA